MLLNISCKISTPSHFTKFAHSLNSLQLNHIPLKRFYQLPITMTFVVYIQLKIIISLNGMRLQSKNLSYVITFILYTKISCMNQNNFACFFVNQPKFLMIYVPNTRNINKYILFIQKQDGNVNKEVVFIYYSLFLYIHVIKNYHSSMMFFIFIYL